MKVDGQAPGVGRALVLREAIRKLLLEAAPPPLSDVDRQDRMFALVDALSHELAESLLNEIAGALEPDYVTERIASFCAEMLWPFTVAAIKDRLEQQPPVGRA